MSTCEIIIFMQDNLHVDINILHINVIDSHVHMNKLHVAMIMLQLSTMLSDSALESYFTHTKIRFSKKYCNFHHNHLACRHNYLVSRQFILYFDLIYLNCIVGVIIMPHKKQHCGVLCKEVVITVTPLWDIYIWQLSLYIWTQFKPKTSV